MKVGFSFGRCVRDIVSGHIDYNDVAWIISGTALRDEAAIVWCIEDYLKKPGYLDGLDAKICKEVGLRLYNEGKIFQPRLQNITALRIPEGAVWADLFPTTFAETESAKRAWEHYRFMIHMTAIVPEDVKENWKG